MLPAVKSLYESAALGMNIGGRTDICVPSDTGVPQGCPLSPTLFGLFLDGIHRYLVCHCPIVGPSLRDGTRMADLGYADDVALLSQRAAGLQGLIDAANASALRLVCALVLRRFVMVFGAVPERFAWTCGGQPVQCVDSRKYLGVQLSSVAGMSGTFALLHQKCGLLGRCFVVSLLG